MTGSNKSVILIASVLKPVDDPRMYEKIGLTLAGSGKYDVHIIGKESAPTVEPGIIQHTLASFKGISVRRLFAPWRIIMLAMRLRPRVFLFGTHELIYPALLLKMMRGCKLVYDVQENYYWRILYSTTYPLLIRPFLASYIRCKEMIAARHIDHFLLAEQRFEQELRFPLRKCTIVENKLRVESYERKRKPFGPEKESINLLFSGTISETHGVFTAIELAIKLHVIDDRVRLTIIGFCPQHSVLDRIRLLIQPRLFIRLIINKKPVPHTEIFKQIRTADFGFITYQITPSTVNSIPAKMYEYLGFKLPIILVNHLPWVEFCHPYNAAIVFDAKHPDAGVIHREMFQRRFYTAEPVEVYWTTEAPRLLEAVSSVLCPAAH